MVFLVIYVKGVNVLQAFDILTRNPAVAEIADRTVLEILGWEV